MCVCVGGGWLMIDRYAHVCVAPHQQDIQIDGSIYPYLYLEALLGGEPLVGVHD